MDRDDVSIRIKHHAAEVWLGSTHVLTLHFDIPSLITMERQAHLRLEPHSDLHDLPPFAWRMLRTHFTREVNFFTYAFCRGELAERFLRFFGFEEHSRFLDSKMFVRYV